MWREAFEQGAKAFPDGLGGAFGGGSHLMFELCKDLFDRVQVGAVRWQEEQVGTRRTDCLANGYALVAAKVVHHHHVAPAQGGHEDLLDIGPEQIAVDRAVEHAGRVDPVRPECANECHRAPVPMRGPSRQARALQPPAAERGHVRFHPGFINEHKPSRVDPVLMALPAGAAAGNVGPLDLGGEDGLFLNDRPSA